MVVELPAPAVLVMHADQPGGGYETVVLADYRVPPDTVERAVERAELAELDRDAAAATVELPRQRGALAECIAAAVRQRPALA